MKAIVAAVWIGIILFGMLAEGAEPSSPVPASEVARVIAARERISPRWIKVVSVTRGEIEMEGFRAKGLRVMAIRQDASGKRAVEGHDLLWSPEYGWYLMEIRQGPFGEEVVIWGTRVTELVVD